MTKLRGRLREAPATGVLIIGAGAAGLRVAIELAARDVPSLVLGKRKHGDAHTRWAAGGINASLGSVDPEDRWQLHAADTLREGHFVGDPTAVELLARRAPERVLELASWGCDFDRTDDGRLNQRYFGAQSFRRTCFVGDETGRAILETLVRRAREAGVRHQEDVYVTSVLVEDGRATGVVAMDLRTGDLVLHPAAAVVIAGGGATSLYRRTSSRPDENTGDAMALALAAGAALRDMEFVQFHPTGMIWPPEMEGRLVTEAVRGEGGRLFNAEGVRFMEQYSPTHMELDARDVVARAIYQEIQGGRASERGGVLLDISHREEDFILDRLPQMHRQFAELGVDITRVPMEVAPTAHYVMGGIAVDFATGATSREGLYAVGEAAGGLHGANRLGGNSLAETVVFGQITGAHLASLAELGEPPRSSRALAADEHARLAALRDSRGAHRPGALIHELRQVLWDHAGIVRSGPGLRAGLEKLGDLGERSASLDLSGDHLVDALNLQAMLATAAPILSGALKRRESRGAHYRTDAAGEDASSRGSIHFHRGATGDPIMRFVPAPEPSAEISAALAEEHQLDYHYLE